MAWLRRGAGSAVDLGDLRRLEPVSRVFGADRGTTIRRYYIEDFLNRHRADLRGRIMEVGDDRYARRFGAADAVVDVLDPDPASSVATLHADLVTGAGLPACRVEALLPRCFEAYIRDLHALFRDGHRVDAMPGVVELLRELSRRADVLLGLLTGNIEAGAHAKLRAAGLLGFFRLGAYGSDHEARRCLPAIACDRARALTGREFRVERTVIIGDTPLDIDCAQACGALAVGVATGQHSAEELRACAPHVLVADFSDVEEAVRVLTTL